MLEDYGFPFAFALTFLCLLFTIMKYCQQVNGTKPISKLSLPPYLIAIVYLSLQSVTLLMAEIGITGDFGNLDKDDDTRVIGTKWGSWTVDWGDDNQWLIRIYYSIRYLKMASFFAFLNQECFHKLILIMYIAF